VIAALIHGYWSMNDAVAREHLRWVGFTLGMGLSLYLGIWVVPTDTVGHPLLPSGSEYVVFLPAPVAMAAAILRYQAFDIKVVINQTLVYGFLTVCVVATFEITLGLLGMLFEKRIGFVISLVVTGLLTAVVFDPLRERVQGGANRLLYGERPEPYDVLRLLGQRLDTTRTPAEVLAVVVDTITQALGVPYVAIELQRGQGFEPAVVYGRLLISCCVCH
jgi:two-component system NarL family sensor kinase